MNRTAGPLQAKRLADDLAARAAGDRPNCPNLAGICRSPYACASIGLCADSLSRRAERRIFGGDWKRSLYAL